MLTALALLITLSPAEKQDPTPTAVFNSCWGSGLGPQSSVGAPLGHVMAPTWVQRRASSAGAGADASSPAHGNSPAHAGSAAPPPRTRISAPAPAPRETPGAMGGSVQVGENRRCAGGARRGAVVAMSPVPRPQPCTDSAAGAHPRAFCAVLQEPRGQRDAGCEGGLQSRVAGCRLIGLYPGLLKASVSPSQLQTKGSRLLGHWKQINRSRGPHACLCSLSWAGRRGVFPQGLGDPNSDPILPTRGQGAQGGAGLY